MANSIRTIFLLGMLAALFMVVGYAIGGTGGLIMALIFSVGTNIFAYWNADKFVLRLQNAEPISRRRAPDLYELVEELCMRAHLPMPKLYVIHADQPNAFATGRNPGNAAVAVSTGLLQHLDRDEVAGVVAHELAHIRNYDTLTMTMGATFAGAISVLAQFGLFFGSRNANSPFGAFGTLLMALFAPLIAMLVQMAVSRTREYEADRGGAEISGNPLALASALEKIHRATKQFENPFARRYPGVAHMYIINPLKASGSGDNIFSTHPNVENRVTALQQLAREMGLLQGLSGQRISAPRAAARRPSRPARPADSASGWRVPSAGRKPDDDFTRGPWG